MKFKNVVLGMCLSQQTLAGFLEFWSKKTNE